MKTFSISVENLIDIVSNLFILSNSVALSGEVNLFNQWKQSSKSYLGFSLLYMSRNKTTPSSTEIKFNYLI